MCPKVAERLKCRQLWQAAMFRNEIGIIIRNYCAHDNLLLLLKIIKKIPQLRIVVY
jgi:hypothetical protein